MFNLFKSKKTTSEPLSLSAQLDPALLLAAIADGIVVVDPAGNIKVLNHAASEIVGWQEGDVLGLNFKSVLQLLDEENKPIEDNENPFFAVLRGGNSVLDNNARLETHAGKVINLSLMVSPLKDARGNLIAAVGIFRDITKEKDEEKQRAEFISTASHEMRTPVAAIEGYLALALNERVSKIDSKARDYLEKAHASTQHLGKLFQDLLTAAKSEDGRLTNHPVVVDVGKFLDESIENMRFVAEKKGLVLEDATQSDGQDTPEMIRPLSYVFVDPERMREVLTNLFDNAIKYTDEGKVTIGLSTADKEVVISVADTGAGIPGEDLPHLFQKFYRVDNSATRQVGGTGLGLFICRKIVELYKGRIWAESEVGKGSTFYVALPRLTPEQAQTLMQQAGQVAPQQSAAAPSPVPVPNSEPTAGGTT